MAHEGTWTAYTAAEAEAMEQLAEAYHRLTCCFQALEAAGADHKLLVKFDDAAGHLHDVERNVIHARLTRVLPHLADVIANACFPEFGTSPEWLPATALPHPVVFPMAKYRRRDLGLEEAD